MPNNITQFEFIETQDAPKAIGPYSQAIAVQNLIFTSGQIPLLPNGDFLDSDIKAQTHQVCKNLQAVLKQANSSLKHVIKNKCIFKRYEFIF